MLYVVPTPIGHLGDLTVRSIEVLKKVDLILAEDTRHSKKLLSHYGIDTHLRSFHSHNEHKVLAKILEELKGGSTIALISDAGTPGISDPGFLLVRACRAEGMELTVLPGATAFVPALVASGFPCNQFYFEGFLPQKKGRQTRWNHLITIDETIILYESPFRLVKCLNEIIQYLGPSRPCCVARELTKLNEDVRVDTAQNLHDHYAALAKVKGEIVVIIKNKDKG